MPAVRCFWRLLAAILHARQHGKGQVIDAAMVDGAASVATSFFGMQAAGIINPQRGTNIADSGSHFYDVYECADGRWISVGPIEPKFYSQFLELLSIDASTLGAQNDPSTWERSKGISKVWLKPSDKMRRRPKACKRD